MITVLINERNDFTYRITLYTIDDYVGNVGKGTLLRANSYMRSIDFKRVVIGRFSVPDRIHGFPSQT